MILVLVLCHLPGNVRTACKALSEALRRQSPCSLLPTTPSRWHTLLRRHPWPPCQCLSWTMMNKQIAKPAFRAPLAALAFSLQSSLFQGYVCPLCREIAKFFKGTWVGHVGLPWFAMFCCEILSVCVSINVCHMQRVICDSCGTWMNLDHDHPGSNSLGMHTITTMERPRPGPTRLSSYMAAAFQPKLQV